MRIRVGLAAAAIAFSLSGHAIAASKSSAIADARRRSVPAAGGPRRRRTAQARADHRFSGVKEGDTVGEFLPGGGYYTRMLSDVVGPKGKVYALETTRWGQQNVDSTKAVLSEPGHGNVRFDASPFGQFNLPEKVDVFWTTLNYHDLHIAKYGVVDMGRVQQACVRRAEARRHLSHHRPYRQAGHDGCTDRRSPPQSTRPC